jgi:hypothetical protein
MNLMKEDNEQHIVYVDAFKADHTNEPLFAVLAAIINLMPKDDNFKILLQQSLGLLKYSAKNLLILGLEKTLGKATIDMVKKTAEETKKNMPQSNTSIAQERLNDHLNANRNLKDLQDALADITEEKEMIIFIDELDRCKPDFALQMLEIIKHVFDVDRIKFVLVTNVYQLEASIKHRYGIDINTDEYLGKFRKYKFTLNRIIDNNTGVSKKYFMDFVNEKYDILLEEYYLTFIKDMIERHNISLRQIEELILCIDVYNELAETKMRLGKEPSYIYTLLILFAITLYCIKPSIIKNIAEEKADASEIYGFLGIEKETIHDNGGTPNYIYILHYIALECTKDGMKDSALEHIKEKYNIQEDKLSNIIIQVYNTLNFNAQG